MDHDLSGLKSRGIVFAQVGQEAPQNAIRYSSSQAVSIPALLEGATADKKKPKQDLTPWVPLYRMYSFQHLIVLVCHCVSPLWIKCEATVFLCQRCFFQSVVLGNFYCETWHSFNQLCISTNSTDGGLQAISIVRLKPQYLFVVCQEAAWLQHTFADTSKYPQQSNLCVTCIFIQMYAVQCFFKDLPSMLNEIFASVKYLCCQNLQICPRMIVISTFSMLNQMMLQC